ncbi:glutamate--cysteine ligase [Aliikangiella sp. IMCC44653]
MHPLEQLNEATADTLSPLLTGIKRGIEKESLRIQSDGHLAQTPHPDSLGATLTNSHITTDYSEALPEFITTASSERLRPLQELTEIHQFAYKNLSKELLWSASMPCVMSEEKDIPIARYGTSNSAKMKEIYRLGLGHRYGRLMQTIAGVHYNFSLPDSFWKALHEHEKSDLPLQDFTSEKYMGLIRNYLRYSWLIPLFYGASPALCESFLKNKSIDLEELVPGTRYGKFATSLRMSDLGYQNKAQSRLNVSYNSLAEYIAGLEAAITTPDPFYAELGVKKDGEYIQLNTNTLQIENEFYSSIRPKRVSRSGERPTKALRNHGIEYIEVRALDINPFSEIGIEQHQIAFLDSFLLACLFADSPPINPRETGEYQENFRGTVRFGRHPEFCLSVNNKCVLAPEFASQLLNQIEKMAKLLDQAYATDEHQLEIKRLRETLKNLDKTLSGIVVANIEKRKDGFFPYVLELSQQHKESILAKPFAEETYQRYAQEAERSHTAKKAMESDTRVSFEAFLANYYK